MARINDLLERIRFRLHLLHFGLTAKPVRGGSPEGDGSGEGDGEGSGAAEGDGEGSGEGAAEGSGDGGEGSGEGSGAPAGAPAPDASVDEWKAYARKWEDRAKKPNPRTERQLAKERKERAAVEAKLKEREDADKSEQERAIEQARKEARDEAESGFEKARRSDKLEVAVTRLATKGVKVGDGDDAKMLRFADPDDALLHLERAIRRGDVDGDEIFGEGGKVKDSELTAALAELLDQKPHLAAAERRPGKVEGTADGGKGKGSADEAESTDPAKHFEQIRRSRPAA